MRQNTDDEMAAGIDASDAFVCCMSAEYAASKNCRRELDYADQRSKPIFYVNVGDPRWDPRAQGGWLLLNVGKNLWADCRSDAAFESSDGINVLLSQLSRLRAEHDEMPSKQLAESARLPALEEAAVAERALFEHAAAERAKSERAAAERAESERAEQAAAEHAAAAAEAAKLVDASLNPRVSTLAALIPDTPPACIGTPPLLKPGKAYSICLKVHRRHRGFCLEVDDVEKPVFLSARKAAAEGACQAFYADVAGSGDCFFLRAMCCADGDPSASVYLSAAPGSGELIASVSQFRWRLASVVVGFTMAPAEDASRRLRISTDGGERPALVEAIGEPNREHVFGFEQLGGEVSISRVSSHQPSHRQ
jgi:hypothetical protein